MTKSYELKVMSYIFRITIFHDLLFLDLIRYVLAYNQCETKQSVMWSGIVTAAHNLNNPVL